MNGGLSFISRIMPFKKNEIGYIFESEVDRLTGKKTTMGIIEMIKQKKLQEVEKRQSKNGRKEYEIHRAKVLLTRTRYSNFRIAKMI
jgi:hypothetical protein